MILSDSTDYLGLAADAKHRAMAAKKHKDYDTAWRCYMEQKEQLLLHAQHAGFSASQTLSLDGSVSEDLADILRLEGQHEQALVHIMYWVHAGRSRPLASHPTKLKSYVGRCKWKQPSLQVVRRFIASLPKHADLRSIQSEVSKWSSAKK